MQVLEDPNPWFRFTVAVLAVWRLTHLLSAEDGPWNLIVRLRRLAGSTVFGQLLDCFYCLSLWMAIPFCFFVARGMLDRAVAWLALSGAASLLHKFTDRPEEFDPFAAEKQEP